MVMAHGRDAGAVPEENEQVLHLKAKKAHAACMLHAPGIALGRASLVGLALSGLLFLLPRASPLLPLLARLALALLRCC